MPMSLRPRNSSRGGANEDDDEPGAGHTARRQTASESQYELMTDNAQIIHVDGIEPMDTHDNTVDDDEEDESSDDDNLRGAAGGREWPASPQSLQNTTANSGVANSSMGSNIGSPIADGAEEGRRPPARRLGAGIFAGFSRARLMIRPTPIQRSDAAEKLSRYKLQISQSETEVDFPTAQTAEGQLDAELPQTQLRNPEYAGIAVQRVKGSPRTEFPDTQQSPKSPSASPISPVGSSNESQENSRSPLLPGDVTTSSPIAYKEKRRSSSSGSRASGDEQESNYISPSRRQTSRSVSPMSVSSGGGTPPRPAPRKLNYLGASPMPLPIPETRESSSSSRSSLSSDPIPIPPAMTTDFHNMKLVLIEADAKIMETKQTVSHIDERLQTLAELAETRERSLAQDLDTVVAAIEVQGSEQQILLDVFDRQVKVIENMNENMASVRNKTENNLAKYRSETAATSIQMDFHREEMKRMRTELGKNMKTSLEATEKVDGKFEEFRVRAINDADLLDHKIDTQFSRLDNKVMRHMNNLYCAQSKDRRFHMAQLHLQMDKIQLAVRTEARQEASDLRFDFETDFEDHKQFMKDQLKTFSLHIERTNALLTTARYDPLPMIKNAPRTPPNSADAIPRPPDSERRRQMRPPILPKDREVNAWDKHHTSWLERQTPSSLGNGGSDYKAEAATAAASLTALREGICNAPLNLPEPLEEAGLPLGRDNHSLQAYYDADHPEEVERRRLDDETPMDDNGDWDEGASQLNTFALHEQPSENARPANDGASNDNLIRGLILAVEGLVHHAAHPAAERNASSWSQRLIEAQIKGNQGNNMNTFSGRPAENWLKFYEQFVLDCENLKLTTDEEKQSLLQNLLRKDAYLMYDQMDTATKASHTATLKTLQDKYTGEGFRSQAQLAFYACERKNKPLSDFLRSIRWVAAAAWPDLIDAETGEKTDCSMLRNKELSEKMLPEWPELLAYQISSAFKGKTLDELAIIGESINEQSAKLQARRNLLAPAQKMRPKYNKRGELGEDHLSTLEEKGRSWLTAIPHLTQQPQAKVPKPPTAIPDDTQRVYPGSGGKKDQRPARPFNGFTGVQNNSTNDNSRARSYDNRDGNRPRENSQGEQQQPRENNDNRQQRPRDSSRPRREQPNRETDEQWAKRQEKLLQAKNEARRSEYQINYCWNCGVTDHLKPDCPFPNSGVFAREPLSDMLQRVVKERIAAGSTQRTPIAMIEEALRQAADTVEKGGDGRPPRGPDRNGKSQPRGDYRGSNNHSANTLADWDDFGVVSDDTENFSDGDLN